MLRNLRIHVSYTSISREHTDDQGTEREVLKQVTFRSKHDKTTEEEKLFLMDASLDVFFYVFLSRIAKFGHFRRLLIQF